MNFEKEIKSQKSPIIDYSIVESIALNAGISESDEILGSVRFLNDLGSIQYFANESLKNKVIINPQVFRF